MNIFEFYKKCKEYIIKEGFESEILMVENRRFENIKPIEFLREFIYVVVNSGMKNQVANQIMRNYNIMGITAIRHPGKKKAIQQAHECYDHWYKILQDRKTDEGRLEYLELLPWIGKITKYHLARNIGLDVAKPDRHLVRIANYFDFDDVQTMCKQISNLSGDRIGTVDVVIWRYCNLNPKFTKSLEGASPIPPNFKKLGILGGIL